MKMNFRQNYREGAVVFLILGMLLFFIIIVQAYLRLMNGLRRATIATQQRMDCVREVFEEHYAKLVGAKQDVCTPWEERIIVTPVKVDGELVKVLVEDTEIV